MIPIFHRLSRLSAALILLVGLSASGQAPDNPVTGVVQPDITSFYVGQRSQVNNASGQSVSFLGQTWNTGETATLRVSENGVVSFEGGFAAATHSDKLKLVLKTPYGNVPMETAAGQTVGSFSYVRPPFSPTNLIGSLSLVHTQSGEVYRRIPITTGGISRPGRPTSIDIPTPDSGDNDYGRKSCTDCSSDTNVGEIILQKGEGSRCAGGYSKAESTSQNMINMTFQPGGSGNGLGGNTLQFKSNDISQSGSVSLSGLQFNISDSATVTMDSTNSYPETIVTAIGTTKVSEVTGGFTIKFYTTGLATTGSPTSETRIIRTAGSGSPTVRILEQRYGGVGQTGGTTVETRYRQVTGPTQWTILEGAEIASVTAPAAPESDFLRKTVITADFPPKMHWVGVYENKANSPGTFQRVSETRYYYADYDWGTPLIKMEEGGAGDKLTQTWTHHPANAQNRYEGGELASYARYGGDSRTWDYSPVHGRLMSATQKLWGDTETISFFYGSGFSKVRGLFSINGVDYKQYYISETMAGSDKQWSVSRSPQVGTTGYNAPGSLITTVIRHPETATAVKANQLKEVIYPDGTKSSWTYSALGSLVVVESKSGSADLLHGMKRTMTYDAIGNVLTETSAALDAGGVAGTNLDLKTVTQSNLDALGRPLTTTTSFPNGGPDQIESREYSCCGIRSSTDVRGVVTSYHFDHLKRLETSDSLGVVRGKQYNGLKSLRFSVPSTALPSTGGYKSSRTTLPTAALIESETEYNVRGELIRSSVASPQATDNTSLVDTDYLYTYTNSFPEHTEVRTNYADGGFEWSFINGDGSRFYHDGSAVASSKLYGLLTSGFPATFTNGAVIGNLTMESNFSQWQARLRNYLGQLVAIAHSGSTDASMHYNSLGQLTKSVDQDGVTTLFRYNSEGEQIEQILDLNGNGVIDPAIDRITSSETNYVNRNGVIVAETVSKVWDTLNQGGNTAIVTSVTRRSIDGLRSWSIPLDDSNLVNSGVTTLNGNGNWTETTTAATGLVTTRTYSGGLIQSTQRSQPNGGQITFEFYEYDELNRRNKTADARTGAVSWNFYNSGQRRTVTRERLPNIEDDPTTTTIDETFDDDIVTQYYYDQLGRQTKVDLPVV